ncbi:MAG: PVC-type heme-binding CxxCH protein [Cyclobacteriaceae bacterium]
MMIKCFDYNDRPHKLWFLFFLLAAVNGCTPDPASVKSPVEPEKALSTFELEPGFKMELIVAEPLVSDPVDMEIDEYGRLYVLELHGYPLDKSGAGKIKLLTDSDGDGRMDKSTVFAEGLTLPFGIMRWKKGLLVTDAPDVLYMEDSTGDGKADIRKIMLTGFAFSNPQMNVGNPIYGLDNWIYLSSESGGTYQVYKKEFGDLGGDIYYPDKKDGMRLLLKGAGRTVRILPDQYKLELTSGVTQFGHAFDVWGHHLLGNNSNHIYHEAIAAPYLKRNLELLVSSAIQSLTDHGSEVFPITQNPDRQLLTNVGTFTSACGNTGYTGGEFPAAFNDNVYFVAEPVSNIVHADLLKDDGASFIASRIGSGMKKEFLASTDSWFRPVNMYVGPDGALYVLDYYRQVIEHPEWMSEEAIDAGVLYNGKDMGRIYRITQTDAGPATWTKGLALGDASSTDLVQELAHSNSWWRRNAQRLLVDGADQQVVPALEQMASNSPSAMGRLHALWTLEGLGQLRPGLIEFALRDTVAGIRENAIKLLELHLPTAPELAKALLPLQSDANAKVRFQLLCTLGFIDSPESALARNKLLFRDLNDKWVQIAALSAASSQTAPLLKAVLENFQPDVPAYASLVERLTTMIGGSGARGVIRQLIQRGTITVSKTPEGWEAPALDGLAQGLKNRKEPYPVSQIERDQLTTTFFEHPSVPLRNASLKVLQATGMQRGIQAERTFAKAVAIARDVKHSDEKRAEAIQFLTLDDPSTHASLLKALLIPQEPQTVQLAALNALSRIPDQTVTDYVLQQWPALTPAVRNESINTFLASFERVAALLDAIDSGRIQKASVSFYQSVRLMTQRDEKLRKRARSLFANNDEEEANKKYQQALDLKGNAAGGKNTFEKNCAVCHQIRGGNGVSFGPDLGTVQRWVPEGIMAHILAPNLSIAAGYELRVVELHNGESVQGIISSETPSALTLRNAGSVERTINRQDIKSLKTLDLSAMPAGLEANINQQQMADLLAFLRQNK